MQQAMKVTNSNNLLEQAQECYKSALASNNLSVRYKLFQQAKSLEKIAKEFEKWELWTRGF